MRLDNEEWPEDEARATYHQWLGLCEDESLEYADNWLSGAKRHMYDVLDYRDFCMRYDAELARLFKGN